MTLRITYVLEDHDKDDLHIVFNMERKVAQVIETTRQGKVIADRERPMDEVIAYLRSALTAKETGPCNDTKRGSHGP